jgi:D-alanyl-D-alanine dipeptidase
MALPTGFSYLEAIDPTILHNILYAGNDNFLGRPIAGYLLPRCIVSNALGKALSLVQKDALKQGLSLLVYDAYRPLRAVEDFVFWSKDTKDLKMKDRYYPDVNKEDFFALGYVGMRSYHCRGAAVDVTLVPVSSSNDPLDMGTRFDFMDERSHTLNPSIQGEARLNRQKLCALMEAHGFQNYPKEWWHFNLKNEPFPDQYFDFPIS